VALVLSIMKGETSVAEAARKHGLNDGREYWVGDDLAGVLLVEAAADELALLAAAEIELPWLA
jgi:hypothetical protein